MNGKTAKLARRVTAQARALGKRQSLRDTKRVLTTGSHRTKGKIRADLKRHLGMYGGISR